MGISFHSKNKTKKIGAHSPNLNAVSSMCLGSLNVEDLIPTLKVIPIVFLNMYYNRQFVLSVKSDPTCKKQPGAHNRHALTHVQKQSLLSDPLYFHFIFLSPLTYRTSHTFLAAKVT